MSDSSTLPHCDELFLRFFDRWYEEDDRKRKGFAATRPDMLQCASLCRELQSGGGVLTDQTKKEVLRRIDTMTKAVRGDWPRYLAVSGNIDMSWIEVFDAYYDRKRIAEVIRTSQPEDFSNDYLVLCCEFGAALGYVMLKRLPRLVWHLEWPYWESAVLDPKTCNLMPVFHWAVKKMSEYGVDDGFAAKVGACLQMLDSQELLQ